MYHTIFLYRRESPDLDIIEVAAHDGAVHDRHLYGDSSIAALNKSAASARPIMRNVSATMRIFTIQPERAKEHVPPSEKFRTPSKTSTSPATTALGAT